MSWARLCCVLCCALTISIDRAEAQSSSRSASARAEQAAERRAKRRAERLERRAQQRAQRGDRPATASEQEQELEQDQEEDALDLEEDELESDPSETSTPAPVSSSGVIADPELGDLGPPSGPDGDSSSGAISDPELGDSEDSGGGSYGSVPTGSGSDGTGVAHLIVRSRFASDLLVADPREEIWESTTIAALDGTVRRNESLRFGFGLRMRYQIAGLENDVPDSQSERHSLDVAPTAGYADLTAADGLHLMVGYQTLHLGRFEVLSATNVLAVNDLRDGPTTMPEATEVGQLAMRIDYDPLPGLSLRAIYVPFFTPHVVSVIESDYALFRQNQADVAGVLDMLGFTRVLAANLSRGDRARIAETTLAAFAPPATLSYPQGAFRATLHGSVGELGLTAASALEHTPAFRVSQELIDATVDPESPEAAERLDNQPRPVQVEYNRFAVFALDGAIDIAPLSLGFEAAYMLNRTLYTLGTGAFPLNLPLPEKTDIVQVGLRLEYVQGGEWLAAVEAYGAYALSLPDDPNRGWMFFEQNRYSFGVGVVGSWSPDWGLRVELGVIVLNGPSLFLTPRVGYLLFDELEAEVGAVIVEGERPPTPVGPELAFGGLYDTVDQVYIGLRYAP